jgi:hypothetical protein
MTPTQRYNQLLAQKLIEEFEKRNMEGYYCETKADALKKLLDIIPKDAVVSYGGSVTLKETGAIEALTSGDYRFLDPNAAAGATEKEKIAHDALNADYYLMSANAISMTGELVNADGIGNRVAALAFGPKHVVIIAGMNKVETNLESAIMRVKTQAAQKCLLLYKQDYSSFDELSQAASGIISQLVITSMTNFKGRIKIILVGESLGL